MESSITREDRVGEFKVSYVRDKDIKYKHINSPGQMAEVFTSVWDQNEIEYRENVIIHFRITGKCKDSNNCGEVLLA